LPCQTQEKYFSPPIEFLLFYNSGSNSVKEEAKRWFGYRDTFVKTRLNEKKVVVLGMFPILCGIANTIIMLSLFCYIILKGWRYEDLPYKIVLTAFSLWFVNMLFSILASSIALRFQAFPIYFATTFSFVFVDWMIRLTAVNSSISKSNVGAYSSENVGLT
jgi:hypothetical protein